MSYSLLNSQEYFDKSDNSPLEIGDTVRVINSAYIPEIRYCIGVITGSHPCYFPAEGRNLTFYHIRITKPSPDHHGHISGGIDEEIKSPYDGLKLLQKGSK